jgi:TNF receptor-associated protein 1
LRQFCAAPETAETTSKQAAKPAQTHEFKAETKKLLDIVAKSLYTDKEVFIRELISNSSDACEKLRFLQTTSALKETHDSDLALQVRLTTNEAERTFIIEDTGVGMTYDELVENLGTIAKSGSLAFSENVEHDASNIIGQFGVGFYSSFVVADKVEVFTKTCDPAKGDTGYLWSSDGSGEYSISETPGIPRGTKIVLTLKDDAADFSKQAFVKKAVEKFSSFIDFPILIEEGGEFKPVNKQEALWTKTSATPEEHTAFFRFLSGNSYGEPYYSLMYQTDAPLSIKSCFYLPDPDNAPSRFFSRDPEIGVALHSRRVLVKKNADGVIPKWLHWVRGVVDCEDMPMNISRENMQDSRLMEKLSTAVVRRILRFLEQQAKKDEEKYAKFFKAYSYYLKAGIIEDKEGNFGRHKEDLMKLLRFECSEKGKGELVSLADYMSAAKDGQQNIYYLTSTDRNTAVASPYMEQFTQRKRNVLLLFEDIDEFVISSLENFKGHKFVSVDAADKDFELDLDAPEEDAEKKGRELESDERKSLEQFIKSVLKERVQEVKFSDRVVSSPAIVTSIITPHMRKMMKGLMAGKENDGYSNIPMTLELSASHHIVTTLNSIRESNEPVARIAVEQLFDNACIAAGTLDDPRVLMSRLNKVLEMFVYQGAGFDYARNEYVTRDSADAAVEKSTEADGKEAPTQADQNTSPPKTDKQVPPPKAEVKTEPPKFEEVKPSA